MLTMLWSVESGLLFRFRAAWICMGREALLRAVNWQTNLETKSETKNEAKRRWHVENEI